MSEIARMGRRLAKLQSQNNKIINMDDREIFLYMRPSVPSMPNIPELVEQSDAIKHGKFKLSDGSLTDYYIDKYEFETSPDILSPIVAEIASMLEDDNIDVVVGPVLGAVPLVTGISLETGLESAFVRQGNKHYGTQARIEGSIKKGQRVAVVEDVTTTGQTILDTVDVIEELGGVIERLIVVVDRNAEAKTNVAEAGYELEHLVQIGTDVDVGSN